VNLLGSLSPSQFLAQHWQKAPLGLAGSIGPDLPALTADELGWLAMQEDVESRLVFTERNGDQLAYRVEHGPFASIELEQLPPQDWTLLVQDVEKHLPDFRAWFDLVSFIPDWRSDDLMVSFAAPGGSVGPHLDNYDVFLCQGEGQRNWRLAESGSVPADPRHTALSLLQEFSDDNPVVANHRDVLYLPPRVPHWGIAQSNCVTYSIGMRAPTREDLLAHLDNSSVTATASEVFYRDPDLVAAEARPGMIGPQAVQRARDTLIDHNRYSDQQIASALGMSVTGLKSWLTPASIEEDTASRLLQEASAGDGVKIHGMARLAWYESNEDLLLFTNGCRLTLSAAAAPLVRQACTDRSLSVETLRSAMATSENQQLLLWLCQNGAFDL